MRLILIFLLSIIFIPAFAQESNQENTLVEINETKQILNSILQMQERADDWSYIFFIAGVGITTILAVSIFIMSQKTIKEAHKMIKKQDDLLKNVRDVYASSYVHWVQLIAKNFETVIKRYENDYLPNPNIIRLKHSPKEDLMNYYNIHLNTWFPKIELMELVKTFGKSIATSVMRTQSHESADVWSPSRPEGMRQMINDYIERIQDAIELKNKFLPYCDDSLKTKDKSFQKYYDIIAEKQPYPKSENDSPSQDKNPENS